MEVWKNHRIVYDGKVVRLRVGTVTLDTGEEAEREVVEHPGGVCIVPYTGHSVILVRQFRIALGKEILEAPAGKIEGDEDPLARAVCELEEETGYRAGTVVPAGSVFSTVGYCSERIHFYLAFDLESVGQRLEFDERIELVEMPLQDVRDTLRNNGFEDGKTVIILRALIDHLDGERAAG